MIVYVTFLNSKNKKIIMFLNFELLFYAIYKDKDNVGKSNNDVICQV